MAPCYALGNNYALDWKETLGLSPDFFDETSAVLLEDCILRQTLGLKRVKGGWGQGLKRNDFIRLIEGAPWEEKIRSHPFFRNLPLQKPFVFIFYGCLKSDTVNGLGIDRSRNRKWPACNREKFQIKMVVIQTEPGKFHFDYISAIGLNHQVVATAISPRLARYRKVLLSGKYSSVDGGEDFSISFFPDLEYPDEVLRADRLAKTVLNTNEYRRLKWKKPPRFDLPRESSSSIGTTPENLLAEELPDPMDDDSQPDEAVPASDESESVTGISGPSLVTSIFGPSPVTPLADSVRLPASARLVRTIVR